MNVLKQNIKNRLNKFRKKFENLGIEAAIIEDDFNVRYLSGFAGDSTTLFITGANNYLLTDFRYIEQAMEEAELFTVIDYTKKGMSATLKNLIAAEFITKIGYENNTMTVARFEELSKNISICEFKKLEDAVAKIRMIKDAGEIELIAKAASIADKAFSEIFDFIKPGVTELQVAAELEYYMKRQGVSKLSFDTICATGKRSSLPHGKPTNKKIENGDFVTLDFGCIYEGYCSDMTRTVVVGKATEKQKEIYNLVLKAQMNALSKIKAGIKGSEGDALARDIINEAGHKRNFGHGMGHSLGLEVHESPRFSPKCEDTIEAGMIMSVEPGVYIPEWGGVRIEDLVCILNDSVRNFCSAPKELIEL